MSHCIQNGVDKSRVIIAVERLGYFKIFVDDGLGRGFRPVNEFKRGGPQDRPRGRIEPRQRP